MKAGWFMMAILGVFLYRCSAVADSAKKDAMLHFDLDGAQRLTATWQGFNTGNSFSVMHAGEKHFIQAVDSLHPGILRFPGGTIGNFYHPAESGYGLREDELVRIKGNVGEHIRHLYSKDVLHTQSNYIDDFIRLCQQTGSGALLVANILSGSFTELDSMISICQEADVQIKGIELGNEIYLNAYKQIVPDADAYIKVARPFADHIHENYPGIPVALAAEPFSLFGRKTSSWNDQLAGHSFYDAYAVHFYYPAGELPTNGRLEEWMNGKGEELAEYFHSNYPAAIHELNRKFEGRPCWITEWNLQTPASNAGNTMLQAYFMMDFILQNLLQNKSLGYMTVHNLAGKDFAYSLINPGSDADSSTKNIGYYVFTMLAEVARGNFNQLVKDTGATGAVAFFEPSHQVAICFVINRQAMAQPFPGIVFHMDGKEWVCTSEQTTTLSAVQWYSGPGKSGFQNSIETYIDHRTIDEQRSNFQMNISPGMPSQLPAHSITMIRIKPEHRH